jgi:asparagine synthetase B (glutamine-hydrolysing)
VHRSPSLERVSVKYESNGDDALLVAPGDGSASDPGLSARAHRLRARPKCRLRRCSRVCGIAGYSLTSRATVDRAAVARILFAGIAERGADATGVCTRCTEGRIDVVKAPGGASRLLRRLDVPRSASEALLHVRDHTKGHPCVETNNHPIRHGPVLGIHNGIVENDDEVLAAHGIRRQDRRATVDSEAIFALAARYPRSPGAFEQLHASMACAWLDERFPGRLFLARGLGRPLWLGLHADGVFFASTRAALSLLEELAGVRVAPLEVPEGRWLEVQSGRLVAQEAFTPDRTYRPRPQAPAPSPAERRACLDLLLGAARSRRLLPHGRDARRAPAAATDTARDRAADLPDGRG